MQSLWLLTKKNLKLLFRSKSSSLIVFFAPLLTILILGLSYNNSPQYGLNIGIVAPSMSSDVDGVIKALQEQEFRVITYDHNLEECVDDIKTGAVHTCMVLPESFQVEDNTPKEVVFHLDPSKINSLEEFSRIPIINKKILQSIRGLTPEIREIKYTIGRPKVELIKQDPSKINLDNELEKKTDQEKTEEKKQ